MTLLTSESASQPMPAGLESWPFAVDPLNVVVPTQHVLAGRESLRYAEILDHPLVVVQPGGALAQELREQATNLRVAFNQSVGVSSSKPDAGW